MIFGHFRNKELKKYSRAGLLSSSSLLLTGCFGPIFPQGKGVHGTDGDDAMVGTVLGDQFYGSAGADSMDGLTGVDDVRYFASPAAIDVNLTTGIGKGGDAEGDTYVSIEDMVGSNFDDILTGNDADNQFEGDLGADIFDGKAGSDTVVYGSPVGVEVNLTTGIGKGGHAEGDKFINVENIVGSSYDDILIGNNADNNIDGRSGNDVFDGSGGNDEFKIEGQDEVLGGTGTDSVVFHSILDYIVSEITLLKSDNKIKIVTHEVGHPTITSSAILNSVEEYTLVNNNLDQTTDIKTIWDELASAEQAKFNDEADFLSWLGNDAGYNYEGL